MDSMLAAAAQAGFSDADLRQELSECCPTVVGSGQARFAAPVLGAPPVRDSLTAADTHVVLSHVGVDLCQGIAAFGRVTVL